MRLQRSRSRDAKKKKDRRNQSESEEFDPEEEMFDDSDEYGGSSESDYESERGKRGRGRPPRRDSFVVEDSEEKLRKKKRKL